MQTNKFHQVLERPANERRGQLPANAAVMPGLEKVELCSAHCAKNTVRWARIYIFFFHPPFPLYPAVQARKLFHDSRDIFVGSGLPLPTLSDSALHTLAIPYGIHYGPGQQQQLARRQPLMLQPNTFADRTGCGGAWRGRLCEPQNCILCIHPGLIHHPSSFLHSRQHYFIFYDRRELHFCFVINAFYFFFTLRFILFFIFTLVCKIQRTAALALYQCVEAMCCNSCVCLFILCTNLVFVYT